MHVSSALPFLPCLAVTPGNKVESCACLTADISARVGAPAHPENLLPHLVGNAALCMLGPVMGASDTLLICVYLWHYEVGAGSVQASCRNRAENSPIRADPEQSCLLLPRSGDINPRLFCS